MTAKETWAKFKADLLPILKVDGHAAKPTEGGKVHFWLKDGIVTSGDDTIEVLTEE